MPAAAASEPPELEMEYEELAPGDEGFDFAEKLAEELAEVAEIAPMGEGAEMIDVETVFEQFKKGVAEQVSEDDSDTHFDLGIAPVTRPVHQQEHPAAAEVETLVRTAGDGRPGATDQEQNDDEQT